MHLSFDPKNKAAEKISFDDFLKVDIRLGKIIEVSDFPKARNPSYKLKIDFGEGVGLKSSSAQITSYTKEELEGQSVLAVVNFEPRNIAGFMSEVLVLGLARPGGEISLPLLEEGLELGARLV